MNSPVMVLLGFLFTAGISPVLARTPGTYTVKRTEIEVTARFSGEVESPPPITFSSPAQGKILWVKAQGETVKKGEKAEQIDPIRARIGLKGARNRMKIARRVLEQKRELLKLGLISKQEFLQYQARFSEIEGKVRLLSYQIRASELISPADGVILRVFKGAGSMVAPGEAVLTIMPTEGIYILVRVPVDQASLIRTGARARILLPDGKAITGKVGTLSPAGQGFVYARVLAGTPMPANLLDSMVSVEITVAHRKALVVPSQDLVERKGRFFVFVAHPNGKLERREVKLGVTTEKGCVEVLSGLKEGEKILAKGAYEEEYKNIKQYIHKED
jgi:RND family efflux transporter MFP subunit